MDYNILVEFYKRLEDTTKRLEKTYIISDLLEETKPEDLKYVIYLLEGRVFPTWDQREIGFSQRLMLKALAQSSGTPQDQIEKLFTKLGDLGLVAKELITHKKQATLFSQKLTVKKVFTNIESLASLTGEGTVSRKVSLVSELLTSATPDEAKFIVRTVLSTLRVGVAQGILRDAIAWAYYPKVIGIFFRCENCNKLNPKSESCLNCKKPLESNFKEEIKKQYKNCARLEDLKQLEKNLDKQCIMFEDEKTSRAAYNVLISKVQEAYDLSNDFAEVALAVKQGKELKIKIDVGHPINPMLATRLDTLADAFEELQPPVLVDYKLDGFRLQIHKKSDKYFFFTRRLENVYTQFAELKEVLDKSIKQDSYIIDTEVIGFDSKTKRYLPFQQVSQRIKRKYDIEKVSKEIPVVINVFDVLYLNGKSLLEEPQRKRREIIEKIIKEIPNKIKVTDAIITDNLTKAEKFYKESLKAGNEGVIIKNLYKKYTPGRRVKGWIKFKPSLEPLDLVIIGATHGEGKRSEFLSSYILACKSGDKLLECGMSSSGLKEKSQEGLTYKEMTEMLNKLITKREARTVYVKPQIIVEVIYEEIQKSPTYASGYALRFPRITRLREDKPLKDIATIQDLKRIYAKQKGKKQ